MQSSVASAVLNGVSGFGKIDINDIVGSLCPTQYITQRLSWANYQHYVIVATTTPKAIHWPVHLYAVSCGLIQYVVMKGLRPNFLLRSPIHS